MSWTPEGTRPSAGRPRRLDDVEPAVGGPHAAGDTEGNPAREGSQRQVLHHPFIGVMINNFGAKVKQR